MGALVVALWSWSAVGCSAIEDVTRRGGNSAEGYFEVQPEADVALGTRLRFSVTDYGLLSDDGNIGLTAPMSSAPSVAAIQDVAAEGALTIVGMEAGSASIDFSARADGDVIADRFSVAVTPVTQVSFSACADFGVYLRGAPAGVPYRFNPKAARAVRGLGLYPVTWLPSADLSLNEAASNELQFVFDVSKDAGNLVTLTSTLEGDTSNFTLAVADAAGLSPPVQATTAFVRGRPVTLDLRPRLGEVPVCSRLTRTLKSLTPTTCVAHGAINGTLTTSEHSVTLDVIAVGTCTLIVAFAELSLSFELPPMVVSSPSSSGGGGGWDD
ncbi:MAG: hypothetical protein QM756_14865 [Polyangiaceae bacterium]